MGQAAPSAGNENWVAWADLDASTGNSLERRWLSGDGVGQVEGWLGAFGDSRSHSTATGRHPSFWYLSI